MSGRPQATEAAPYYFLYINQVPDEDVTAVLEQQVEDAARFFQGVSEEKSLYRYAEGKWSIRETLNHINDVERIFGVRALWFARGFEFPLPSFDQHVAVSGANADRISLARHMEEFRRVRLSTLALFQNLPAEAWSRGGVASDNPFTVRALAYIIAGHVNHHMAVIRERYLQA
jgi:uncharacterized damage-inducible protein DinB